MIDIRPKLDSMEVYELINALEYPPNIREIKTEQILAEYRYNPDQLLLGFVSKGELVALIGLQHTGPNDAVIRHIVVRRDCRRHGLGREMVNNVCKKFSLGTLTAETDNDTVQFYRRIGFQIKSLGKKYPGVERFECRLKTKL